MPTCCVSKCKSNSRALGRKGNYVPVFKFPRDETRRELWKNQIQRRNLKVTKNSCLCIHHFEERFLIRELKATRPDGTVIVLPRKHVTLTNDAYPTIFQNTDDVLYDLASKHLKKDDPEEIKKKICELETENSMPYICTGRDTVIPYACCVPYCRSNSPDGPKVALFPFPQDQETLQKWLSVIKMENFKPTDATRVCEIHFRDIDIERIRTFTVPTTGKLLTSHLKVPRLVKGAIPNKFPTPALYDNCSTKQEKSEEISNVNVDFQPKEEPTVTSADEVNLESSHTSEIDGEFENCTIENLVSTTSTLFSKICRTCFAYSEMVYSISEFSWEGVHLQEIIQNWTTLKVNEKDKLPKQMCTRCATQMYKTYNFLVKCKTTETALNRILEMEAIKNAMISVKEVPTDSSETYINATQNIVDINVAQYSNSNISNDSSEVSCTINIKSETASVDQEVQVNANSETDLIREIESIKNNCKQILANPMSAKESEDEDEQISNAKEFIMIKSDHTKVKGNVERVQVSKKKYPINSCIPCDRSFVSAKKLRSHLYVKHRKDNMFVCPYCQKKDKFPAGYILHVRYHTGEIVKSCSICEKGFCSKLDLNRHLRVHYNIRPYVCKICKKGFRRRYTLSDHMRTHTGEKRICPICGATFLSYAAVRQHEKRHKIGSMTFKDGQQGTTSTKQSDGLLCHICNKMLSCPKTLEDHLLRHGPKKFICDICGKGQITEQTLRYHKKVAHPDKMYKCNVCDKEYRQKDTLTAHMRWHTGEGQHHFCEFCGKVYKDKGSYRQHLRKHTGDTTYQCKLCLLICINKRHLEGHMRSHTGEKPFSCEICGQLFGHEVNLWEHKKHHGEENKIKCKFCTRIFYSQSRLRRHLKLKHEQKYSEETLSEN